MTDILEELELHPPRCVESLRWGVLDVPALKELQREDGFSYFRVGCSCGVSDCCLLGYASPYAAQPPSAQLSAFLLRNALRVIRESFAWKSEPEDAGLSGPLSLHCESCGRDSTLFDPRVDGARAELGHASLESPHAGREAFRCRPCHSTQMQIQVGVGYGQTSWQHAHASRPQDLFDVFQVFARCSRCENTVLVSQASTVVGVDVWRAGKRRDPSRESRFER